MLCGVSLVCNHRIGEIPPLSSGGADDREIVLRDSFK
jgi:hypothetical protein